jgi:hypothetical protein
MCPITETKKKAAQIQTSELSNLQKHGMSEDSMKGKDEIASLTGERGKAPVGPVQSLVRKLAKGFFGRAGKSDPKAGKK